MLGESLILPPKGDYDLGLQSELAFAYESRSGLLVPVTGQTARHARASAAWAHDYAPGLWSRPHRHVHSQPRFDWMGGLYNAAGVKVGTPGFALAVELASDNLCPASEDHSGWTGLNSPTVVANAGRCGDVALASVGDTSGASVAQLYRVPDAMTGLTQKAYSVFLRRGSSPAASGGRIYFRDQTAGVDRGSVNFTFDAAGFPTFTPTAGSVLGFQESELGWRLFARSNAIASVGNTHRLGVEPARVAGEQGNVLIGGWQLENGLSPTSYIKRVSVAAAARAAETLYWDFESRPPTRTGLQLLVVGVEMGTRDANLGLCDLGGNANTPRLILFSSSGYQTQLDPGSGATGALGVGQPTWGQHFAYLVTLFPNGSHQITSSIAGGNSQTSTLVAPPASWPPNPVTWGAPRFTANQYNAATAGNLRLLALKIGWGTHRTLDQLLARV